MDTSQYQGAEAPFWRKRERLPNGDHLTPEMLGLSAISAVTRGRFHAAQLYMSHALAPRVCSLPLAAACRVTLHQVNGITGRGINCGNNGSSRLLHQVSRAAAAGDSQTERDPSQFAASAAGNGAAEIPAAMADIRTMLIDLDDCLYDIPVRRSCASDCIQTVGRELTASAQMRSQRALPVLSELIWRQVLRRHSATPHASHIMDSGLASRTATSRAPQRSLEILSARLSARCIAPPNPTGQLRADSPSIHACRSSRS
jgi:hypothetical protein